jgi:hypothetical protein
MHERHPRSLKVGVWMPLPAELLRRYPVTEHCDVFLIDKAVYASEREKRNDRHVRTP